MNSNAILSSDVLDILFDKRNKTYGAYILRKFYPNRVKTSLFIMLGMVAVFSAFTLLPERKNDIVNPYNDGGIIVKTYEVPKEKEQPKQKKSDPQKTPTQKLTSIFLTVQNKDSSDVFHNITNLAIGNATNIDDFPEGTSQVITVSNPGTSNAPTPPEPTAVDNTTIVDDPDIQASYPGGNKELVRFLEKNLLSPEDISESVQVKIKFVVGFDGNLESFDIIKDGGNSFNSEVIRVLKKMPKWNPGKKGGRNVPVYYFLPVKFTPNE